MKTLLAVAACLLSPLGLLIVSLAVLAGCGKGGKDDKDDTNNPRSPWYWMYLCARDKSGCVTPGQEKKE